jgi:hypothetical protein
MRDQKKTERNGPCICGSGKKYKKCCGRNHGEGGLSEHVPIKPGICNFECAVDCAGQCCGGATVITIDEIGRLYDVFPITVGFRKYIPVDAGHEAFLEAIGTKSGGSFMVGDFIAGNWRATRCELLGNDNLCGLHREGRKPAQCSLVPFCAIYPVERQDAVFMEQKKTAFSRCAGFRAADDTSVVVWRDGKFTDKLYGAAFSAFQSGLLRQKPFMAKILRELKRQTVFREFLRGSGILEAAIPGNMLFDLLDAAGVPAGARSNYIDRQKELFVRELQKSEKPVAVFADSIETARRIQEEGR